MPSLKKKSINGLFWDFSGKIGLQSVGFFVSIILARILAPEDFGLLAIIMVFIGLAGVFLDFGFSTALVQRSEVTELHYSSVFFMNIIMGIVLGGLVFLLAPFIARFYERDILVNLIRVMSFSFIINAFGNVTRAHLRREMDFKIISYANIASAVISGGIAIYMAYHGYGVWSLVIQAILGQLLSNVFLYVGCKVHFALVFSLKPIKELWGFSSRIFFSGLIDTIFINLDSLFIGKLLSPTTLGYYYRAKSLESFSIRYTSGSVASVLLPSLSSIQNEKERFNSVVIKYFHILSFISFLLSGVLLVCAEEIIILLFSEKWKSSIIYFQIIISGAFASQLFTICYNVLLSKGQSEKYLLINVISKFLSIISIVILFYGDIITYLVLINIVKLLTLIMGVFYASKLMIIGNELLKYIFKYSVSFLIVSLCVFYFFSQVKIDSLLVSLIFKSTFFTALYFIVLKLVIPKSFNIALGEIILILKK